MTNRKKQTIPEKESIILLHGFFKNEIFEDLKKKNDKRIFIMEGRPNLVSSRMSSRKILSNNKMEPTIISDNMAGFLFWKGCIKEVLITHHDIMEISAGRQNVPEQYKVFLEECKNRQDHYWCPTGSLMLALLSKKYGIPIILHESFEKLPIVGTGEEILQFNHKRVAPSSMKGFVPLLESVSKEYFTNINV